MKPVGEVCSPPWQEANGIKKQCHSFCSCDRMREAAEKGKGNMILSVSRRTDIPNYYSDWFYNRIKAGFLYVRNPMNAHQISEIDLSPDVVDCIVFWTKNPGPMIDRLDELKDYSYYFQFTLTGYGTDIEKNVPHKKKVMIPVFQKLSETIGKERVIWRYDPIFFTGKYTMEYHINAFKQIADALAGYTEKCVISFVDIYAKNRNNLEALNVYNLCDGQLMAFAGMLSEIAAAHGMEVASCAEKMDLRQHGIRHNSCIDRSLIESIIGCRMNVSKDKNQRGECGCVESVEIGAYNTCKNGCIYCYANYSQRSVMNNCSKYNPNSPLLCGEIMDGDRVTKRTAKSVKESQLNIFDL